MAKVIKIFLKQGFTPIDKRLLKRGTCLNFDCYIQRFNGFAIVIEKGTFLSERIYATLIQRHLHIYVHNRDYSDYQAYCFEHGSKLYTLMDEEEVSYVQACENALGISKITAYTQNITEKLNAIYENSKVLFDVWLKQKEETLPLDALESLVNELVFLVNEHRIRLSHFNTFLDERDLLSAHLVKVAFFSALLGAHMGINPVTQKKLVLAAMLHDIGKSELDEALLAKPDFLNPKEIEIMQRHVELSVERVKKSGIRDRVILNAIKDHHERLDGSGYPRGRVGIYIGSFAKVIAICDMFDALITIKPYRGAYSTYNALALMRDEGKNKLDTEYIKLLISHLC